MLVHWCLERSLGGKNDTVLWYCRHLYEIGQQHMLYNLYAASQCHATQVDTESKMLVLFPLDRNRMDIRHTLGLCQHRH